MKKAIIIIAIAATACSKKEKCKCTKTVDELWASKTTRLYTLDTDICDKSAQAQFIANNTGKKDSSKQIHLAGGGTGSVYIAIVTKTTCSK